MSLICFFKEFPLIEFSGIIENFLIAIPIFMILMGLNHLSETTVTQLLCDAISIILNIALVSHINFDFNQYIYIVQRF